MTNSNSYQDDVIVLKVKDWQTSDRMAEGFSREHGKVLFIAYGVRHMRNRNGALVQNLTHARMQFTRGRKFDTLKQCELLPPLFTSTDIEKIAYASFVTELTSELTVEHQEQEEVYELLVKALSALDERNPRLVVLAFACQLLTFCGVAPNLESCVCCDREIADEDAWISAVQGGVVCSTCKTGAETEFSAEARNLAFILQTLDFTAENKFSVKGKDIITLEDFLYKFIFVQVEKPLKSLQFLANL